MKTFFDYENEFLLSNCVWSLNFVALRLLHYKILFFLSILLNRKCYFLLFFFVPKLLLFYYFLKEYFLWKIINSIYDWCIIYPHFVSYKKINDLNVTTIQMSTKQPTTASYLWTCPWKLMICFFYFCQKMVDFGFGYDPVLTPLFFCYSYIGPPKNKDLLWQTFFQNYYIATKI